MDELVDLREDGSILLNMDYFDYATGLKMCHDKKWERLLGVPKRPDESELTQEYMDLALAIQQITDEIVLKLAETAKKTYQMPEFSHGRRCCPKLCFKWEIVAIRNF